MLTPKPFFPDDAGKMINSLNSDQASSGRSFALEPWKPMSLTAPWRTYTGGILKPAEYTKDRFGFVHLRGIVETSSNVSAGATIGRLPVGYRPLLTEGFAQSIGSAGTNSVGAAQVTAAGLVVLQAVIGLAIAFPFTVAYVWLSNIAFYAEA